MDNCESDELNFIDQIIDYRLIIDLLKMTDIVEKKSIGETYLTPASSMITLVFFSD